MKKLIVSVVVAGSVASVLAGGSRGWLPGDGSLDDDTHYLWGAAAPTAEDNLYFLHPDKTNSWATSVVTIPANYKVRTFSLDQLEEWYAWKGTNGWADTCAVTLKPADSLNPKFFIQDWTYQRVVPGRQLVIDGVQVISSNVLEQAQSTGGFDDAGRMLLKNGAAWVDKAAGTYPCVSGTGAFSMRDADVDLVSFEAGMNTALRFYSGSFTTPRWPAPYVVNTNVQVRDAKLSIYAPIYSAAYFPSGKDGETKVTIVSDSSFMPELAGGEKIALRGAALATNSTGATVSRCILTNDVCFYGRGKLNTGFLDVMYGCTADFDLDTLELGYRIAARSNPSGETTRPNVNFRNGVTVKMYDNRDGKSTRSPDFSYGVTFYGNCVFDAADLYTGRAGTVNYNHQLRFYDRAGATFKGGTYTLGYAVAPILYSCYAIGDDTSVTEKNYNWNVPVPRRTRAFRMGKNAKYATEDSAIYTVVVGDDVDVDSTATLTAHMATEIGDNIYPVFCSLAKSALPCTVKVTTETAGASIKWVGGTAYYSRGTKDYGGRTTQGQWLGGESALWSNSANWGGGQMPYYGGVDAIFCGESNTIVTIDKDNAGCLSLRFEGGAPFILRGKALKICRSLSPLAIRSYTKMPSIIECPIVANGDLGCASKNNAYANPQQHTDDSGLLALMGAVDVKNGQFHPSGSIVVGGTMDCRELVMDESIDGVRYRYGDPDWAWSSKHYTQLSVVSGGVINVSNQTTANTATGSIWIAKGGKIDVTGRWDCDVATNEHDIEGLFDLSAATIGGSAAQGYFGSGLVRMGTTDGSAAVRLGEGITLETTAATWGTMPIELPSDATISNETSWTYAVAGGIRVTGPGHALTIDSAADTVTTIETGIDGYDFDLVKTGAGKLVLKGDCDGLKRGTLDLQAGTLAIEETLKVRTLKAASGTSLALGAKDGQVASIYVEDDVDLSRLTLKATNVEAKAAIKQYTNVITVPWDCDITGLPTVTGVKLRMVTNADGSKSLQARGVRGMLLLIK